MKPFILFLWITTADGTTTVDRAMETREECIAAGRAIEAQIRLHRLGRTVWACVTKKPETAL